EQEHKKLTKANKLVYINHKTGEKCPFADSILEEFDKVDCDFGDTGQGQEAAAWQGSPLYPSTFQGLSGGLHSFPLGFYADNDTSRNMFFGLYSLQGRVKYVDQLTKLAEQCEGKLKQALDDILLDISTSDKDHLDEKLEKLESILNKY